MDLIESGLANPIQHWYYWHKFKAILTLIVDDLPRSNYLVDVGAGSALFSLELLKNYSNLVVVAIDTGYEKDIEHSKTNRISYRRDGLGVVGDIYLFTDILEHLPNDIEVLKDYVNLAPIGAKFVVTVPAFMSLFSGHDIYLKHFRRYRKKQIEFVLQSAGLCIKKSQYLYSLLFPLAWIMRKLPSSRDVASQMKDHGVFINIFLRWILQLDFNLLSKAPFGISIIALAEKISD